MLGSLFFLLSFAVFAYSACSPQTVDDASTKDTPTFDSGSITSDTLLMTFSYSTYGAESNVSYSGGIPSISSTEWQRYIDSAATGFVQVANASAALCSPLSTQISSASDVITGIITYEDGSCKDSVSPSVTWSTVKNACGNQYFVSSGGTNGAAYEVDFVYRVTYVEQLSSGDSRTVSNDYSFKVLSPTEFTIDSSSFQLANVATQVSAQTVKVDSTGQVTLNIQAIATCGATLTAVTIGTQVGLSAATPSILSSGAPGTQYGAGTKYAGLCPYYWTVVVDPTGGGCSLSGNFHVTYDFTPTGSTAFTTPDQIIVLSSSDTCTLQQISGSDWGSGDFQLKLNTASDGGGSPILADTVVNYGQTAHWEIVASKSTSDVPKPVSFDIKSISRKMGTDISYTLLTIDAGLVLNNNDGGVDGVKQTGTSTAYSLYWSHLWSTSFFPPSTTRTSVTLRVTFDLAYPSVPTTPARISHSTETTANGRRNFFEHRIISRSTSSFGLVSPRFVLVEGQSSAANLGLIIGLSVMGGVIVIGAAVAVFFLVKYKRRQARPAPAADMEAQSSSSIKDFE